MTIPFRFAAKWWLLVLLWGSTSLTLAQRVRKDNNPNARRFVLDNLSSSKVEVYWMSLATEERILQMELLPGAKDHLNSHILHEFEVREMPTKDGTCKGTSGKNGTCRKRYFQISAEEDHIFTVTSDFKVVESNSLTRATQKAKDTLKECRDLVEGGETSPSPLKMDQLAECMAQSVQARLYEAQEEFDFNSDLRVRMGNKLEKYACDDPAFPETLPIEVQEWNPNNPRFKMDDDNHTTKVLLQANTTMIATIENMARPSDCDFMESVAEIDPESGLGVPWDARKHPETIDFLSRVFAYVDPAVKLMDMYAGLPAKGQSLYKIYHDSSGGLPREREPETSAVPESWPVNGDYFARLYMFCGVPGEEGGGALHFPESGAHVYPKMGEGLLVTYTRAPARKGAAEQFSNYHIDCPIMKGNLTVLQQQFRLYAKDVPV